MNATEKYLYDNAQAFIYVFISDKDVPAFNETIARKRLEQKEAIARVVNLPFAVSVDTALEAVKRGIQDKYGMSPKEVLYRLAQGKTVLNKDGIPKLSGIGVSMPIDARTGYPDGSTYSGNGIGNYGGVDYMAVQDTEQGTPIGVFNGTTGEQVSYYDGNTGTFKSGGNGNKSFWSWAHTIISGLSKLIDFFTRLFGGKRINDVRPFQNDGFYLDYKQQQAGTGLILPLIIAGGVIFAMNRSGGETVESAKQKYLNK